MKLRCIFQLAFGIALLSGCASVTSDVAEVKQAPAIKFTETGNGWRLQDTSRSQEGGYRSFYRMGDSLNMVVIESMPEAMPVPEAAPRVRYMVEDPDEPYGALRYRSQQWRRTTILGQSVKWYQVDEGSGADFPAYESVVFTITHPDGQQGRYRIRVMAESEALAKRWISKVGW